MNDIENQIDASTAVENELLRRIALNRKELDAITATREEQINQLSALAEAEHAKLAILRKMIAPAPEVVAATAPPDHLMTPLEPKEGAA